MRRKIVIVLLASSLLSVAYLGAQCSANQDLTKATATAVAAAQHAKWPLQVPRNQPIRTLEDFRGALLLAGPAVYQIESIRWRITPGRDLEVVALDGYTQDGLRVQFDKALAGGRMVESVADFADFHFGRPKVDAKSYLVDSVDFSTDALGIVSINRFSGVDVKTNGAVLYARPARTNKIATQVVEEPKCGLRVQVGCDGSSCVGGACGGAPACPCNGESGACSGHSDSVCSGNCPAGRTCNGFVSNCGCERDPVVVPPGGH